LRLPIIRISAYDDDVSISFTRPSSIALAAAAFALGAPSAASATIAFVRGNATPSVWSAANNGSSQRRLATGYSARISPNGTTVAFMPFSTGSAPSRLALIPAGGGSARTLASGWREPYVFAWSPDSSTIATVLGPEVGKDRLVLIDVRSGSQRTVAKGYFGGVSFSPNGASIVYSVARSERYPQRSNVYKVGVTSGTPVALTSNQRSLSPLWGPAGKIVFVQELDAKHRLYGPKNELFTMNEDGGQVRRLTHTSVPPLLQGLTPTQWSGNGSRLLAEYGGQDTSYAVTVNPKTGAQKALNPRQGLVGSALSANGGTILGYTGFLGPGPHNIVTVPYSGGKPKLLIKNGFEPSWSS
jgi:Tol biopolymer transport system component